MHRRSDTLVEDAFIAATQACITSWEKRNVRDFKAFAVYAEPVERK
jgi:hypothetical protein